MERLKQLAAEISRKTRLQGKDLEPFPETGHNLAQIQGDPKFSEVEFSIWYCKIVLLFYLVQFYEVNALCNVF
jgi:hypothetical protein